mgnify:CR=1 FL=1
METISAAANFLTREDLMAMAPSVFANRPDERVSGRYSFVPTWEIVETLGKEGWIPIQASQTRSKKDTAKHLIRFRHNNATADFQINGLFPELVVTNSHDRSSSFLMQAGLFRLVCGNGMIVSAANFARIQLIHTKVDKFQILEGAAKILELVPRMVEDVRRFQSIELKRDEQIFLAQVSARIRWGQAIPVGLEDVILPRRAEDSGSSLWRTFNVIQEHLTKGGLRGVSASGKRIRTRPISSIDNDLKLNDRLWVSAEWMATAKEGGRNRWSLPNEDDVIDLEKEEVPQ